ncbi:hypothetical protein DSO57_1004484 [Entomophthora muscae]|uniref:Uncharacterized protein n=1 Tax=Entomophthora muscae TaxID=34485 RepID=A0ACC2UU11_9FUNG|nr:hypothetical protein DSO57_1004484 [Entomophthora muscae]
MFAFIHNSTTLFHPYICSLLATKSDHFALHAGDSSYPLSTLPPAQDFILGLANQVAPHTGSWHSLATAINHLVRIAPIVYLAFQARPASPVGVQPHSDMSHDTMLIMGSLQERFPPGTPMDIQEKVLNKKHLFKNLYGTLHCILSNGECCVLRRGTNTQQGILTLGLDS